MSDRENPEELRVPGIIFLGEQDGGPERELKSALQNVFSSLPVTEAFLADIRYENESESRVALCLVATEDEKIVEAISRVFWNMFRSDVSLDLVFLDEKQREAIEQVCRCFYQVEKA
ncbi:MAG: enhanced serine sensitivity protein SseB C-terminal domain-containing protein [Terriglobia bacterium]|jgi:hypothetical protein|nr:enhanced serine sensitivity protein SseB C-terminal domain-containing protein [Terriglobia bacterium]